MCWHLVLMFAVVIGASMLPDAAMASTAASGSAPPNAIEQVFCNLVSILTGTTGKAIATVAIIAVGIGALLGKISWGMALIVALGVALIFGAATIVAALGGSATSCSGFSEIATS
jgi:type IV secretion system protein VirB2